MMHGGAVAVSEQLVSSKHASDKTTWLLHKNMDLYQTAKMEFSITFLFRITSKQSHMSREPESTEDYLIVQTN